MQRNNSAGYFGRLDRQREKRKRERERDRHGKSEGKGLGGLGKKEGGEDKRWGRK